MKLITNAKQIVRDHKYLIFRQECGHFMIGTAYHDANNEAFAIENAVSSSGQTWWRCGGCEMSFNSRERSAQEHVFWELGDGV